MIVYIELGTVLIQSYLFVTDRASTTLKARPHRRRKSSGALRSEVQRRRSHRSSSRGSSLDKRISGSDISVGEAAIEGIAGVTQAGQTDQPGPVRDFEGVGGWRFPGPDEEDTQWTLLNSRLELPAAPERKRRHRRSLTSSSVPLPSDGWMGPSRREEEEKERERRKKKHNSTSSGVSTSSTGVVDSRPSSSPVLDFENENENPDLLSRSVPDLGGHRHQHHPHLQQDDATPAVGIKQGNGLARSSSYHHHQRPSPSSSSSPTSSRASSRGSSQLLMKHSLRD